MKISAEVKAQTRVRILEAAVDVITEKGFKQASMREIAQRADLGDATIYNYFSTKDKLLFGYCEYVQEQVMEELKNIEDFHSYTIQEQLHQLVETELRVWLPAREFLQQVFEYTFASPVSGETHLAQTRVLMTTMVSDLLDSAMEAGEIPEQAYKELLPRFFWDYMSALLAYWLKDESDQFSNTTQLVDRSMDIAAQLLYSGIIGKTLDLFSFLFRTHILNNLGNMETFFNDPELLAAKRRFMDGKP